MGSVDQELENHPLDLSDSGQNPARRDNPTFGRGLIPTESKGPARNSTNSEQVKLTRDMALYREVLSDNGQISAN